MIDLDRLREAWAFAGANTAEREYLAKAADVVLDAPREWRCLRCVMDGYGHDGPHEFGEVALVPVTGEGR